ncbi:MAG: GNAT family N-acetyltransferase [Defluviitaleaceae bacterium]|nr:GNAT family N-acetyltransferase [Defluviitaleaceae bacterium]MCL2273888.1 GNAT family N-acetyltransferase [Defluviitaleaceae bacterium]
MKITYRKATPADMHEITTLLAALYEMPFDEMREENEELFADKNQAFFLAYDNENPVAVSHGAIRREYVNGTDESPVGFLEAIYVTHEYRKHGIAARLVRFTELWMAQNGCRQAASDCEITNTVSRNFHLKIGYRETERCIYFAKPLAPPAYEICPINDTYRAEIQPVLNESWRGPFIAVNAKLWDTREMAGFAAIHDGEVLGYLLYEFHSNVCEIMVLESLAQNIGIASALIKETKQLARTKGVQKIIVQTNNANFHAIRFYQRRGFILREVRINAYEAARKIKPSIPLHGKEGIPLRDEIEFEISI